MEQVDLFRKKGGERGEVGKKAVWVGPAPTKTENKAGGKGGGRQEEVVLGTQCMALQSRYCKVAGFKSQRKTANLCGVKEQGKAQHQTGDLGMRVQSAKGRLGRDSMRGHKGLFQLGVHGPRLESGVAFIRDDKVAGGRVLGSYLGREACVCGP